MDPLNIDEVKDTVKERTYTVHFRGYERSTMKAQNQLEGQFTDTEIGDLLYTEEDRLSFYRKAMHEVSPSRMEAARKLAKVDFVLLTIVANE